MAERCACGNRFDGDNFCMPSACQWEGIEPDPDAFGAVGRISMTVIAGNDAANDQPPGFPGGDNPWLPPANEAAERVLAFVSWYGDGRVNEVDTGWGQEPPLFARDLEVVAKAARVLPPAESEHDPRSARTIYETVTPDLPRVIPPGQHPPHSAGADA